MASNAAIFFEPEAYSISGPRIMGRNAAGNSFLCGLFQHSSTDVVAAFCADEERITAFKALSASAGRSKPLQFISPKNLQDLSQIGCLYVPEPGLGPYARQRSLYGDRQWSICGITHTILSGSAMDAITGLLAAPIHQWDALICTSRAVHNAVRTILDCEGEYLSARLGVKRFILPKLPIIPLGTDVKAFTFTANDRDRARNALEIGANETVILFFGRLSFHAKAHPAALYRALNLASDGKKIVLIECGWFANDHIKASFEEAAEILAPNLRRIYLDGRQDSARNLAWSSADIFASLTDNLQESFGITPIEAMASGLPVVVADWDGYRDTVRHGIDGFRVPTVMPSNQTGGDLARRYATNIDNYDYYCGLTSQLISVDIEAATIAFRALIQSPDLRRKMGNSGRMRAEQIFDWSKIIKRYEELWEELEDERVNQSQSEPTTRPRHPWPARMNPFEVFKTYPSFTLDHSTPICRITEDYLTEIDIMFNLKSFKLIQKLVMDRTQFENIIRLIPTKPSTTISLLSAQVSLNISQILDCVSIGLKLGILKIDKKIEIE